MIYEELHLFDRAVCITGAFDDNCLAKAGLETAESSPLNTYPM